MRRLFIRLLRLRNLVILSIVLILFYSLKTLNDVEVKHEVMQRARMYLANENSLNDAELSQNIPIFKPTSLRKIDWHDYKQIEDDKKRTGTGEQGKPESLPPSMAEEEKRLYSENGFNGALSDLISLNRSLPDIRHPKCRTKKYIESLPVVSVVVPFHNEHWSTLLRTAASVLRRSPPQLVKEIILVDDASTKEFLKQPLEDYVRANMSKVRIVRVLERSGLITARLAGARAATGDVLVFLDSHTEANVNWLPPLLEPIALSPSTAVCPYIDVVAFDSFAYRAQDGGARGAFDWELFYKRLPLLPRDLENMPEPFRSPVMAGGLFAISRAFFWRLGGYDAGLDIWGGEQYELSFKIWQCGGELLDAPCSRVGHVYRKFAPFPNPNHGDFVGKNYRRVAEVWMDEYARWVYARRPRYEAIDPGDLAPQRALRQRLRCKPFKWFMTQIAFDLTAKYPPVEPEPFAQGRIRPLSESSLCAALRPAAARLSLERCARLPDDETRFVFTWHKDIKNPKRGMCWDLPEAAAGSAVRAFGCHLGGGNQLWRYRTDTHEIRQGDGGPCLDFSLRSLALFVQPCDGRASQRWAVDDVSADVMSAWAPPAPPVTGPLPYS